MASLYLALASLVLLALGFCEEEKVFMQRAGVAFNNREHRSLLFVNNGESFGEWSHPQFCPSGVLTSFQLRVERHRGLFGDDTAANNIKFRCSSNPTLEGPGMDWGEYGYWSEDCTDGGICGIETKMEEYQRGLDDSTLNDVRFHCCNKSQ